ncbi:MAG: cytochrome P450 [Alcanivorax sp.]|nr:cytochrome P450 [Alcanivorax sp.]
MTSSMHTAQADAAKLPRMPQRKLDHIPGDYGMPLLGQTFEFLRDFHGLINRMSREHGLVFRGSSFFQRGVTVLGPDANEFVLRDTAHVFSSRAAWNPLLEKLFTDGLMLRDFADHKYHRRMLQQAFKKKALSGYMTRMNPHIAEGITHWPQDKEFLFFDHVKSLLLDVGAGIFLGLKMGPEAQKVNEAFVASVDASLAVMRLPIPGTVWHRGMKGRRFLEQFMMDLIPGKRAGDDIDFFSELCRAADEETDTQLTDRDVMNHMIFLLFAAHDTTTSTLSSIIFTLARYPEWQDRLIEEFDALGKDELEYDDLEKLTLTTRVFKESLRMFPPLPTMPRRTVEDVEWQGYRIPKNTLVSVVPLHTHYMEEYWTNPYTFDPDRFSPERAEDKKHFFQWVPFGGGHHKCIGLNFAELQTKTFLFHFLRRYRVSVKPGYVMPHQLVPLAVPKDGLPVTISPR